MRRHHARVAVIVLAPQPRVPPLQHGQAVLGQLGAQRREALLQLALGATARTAARAIGEAQAAHGSRLGREQVAHVGADADYEADGIEDGGGGAAAHVAAGVEIESILEDRLQRIDDDLGRVGQLLEEESDGRAEMGARRGGYGLGQLLGRIRLPAARLEEGGVEHRLQLGTRERRRVRRLCKEA
eukprot:4885167-Prymnesium_polylepis.1